MTEWSQGDDGGEIPFWEDEPYVWNVITLGNYTLPGLATITVDVPDKVDEKAPAGGSGGTLTYQGAELCKVEITVRLWAREHWAEFQRVAPFLRPRRKEPTPFDIAHPKCAVWGIRAVLIKSRKGPDEVKPGLYEVKLSCVEYAAASKTAGSATSTPKKSVSVTDVQTAFGNGDYGKTKIGPPAPPSATDPQP